MTTILRTVGSWAGDELRAGGRCHILYPGAPPWSPVVPGIDFSASPVPAVPAAPKNRVRCRFRAPRGTVAWHRGRPARSGWDRYRLPG